MDILIVEDEKTSAQRLTRLINIFFQDDVKLNIYHKTSVNNALNILEENKIGLLFLDLNLNGKNGFDILKYAVSKSFHTIIVSAYAEKASEAFEYGVLDFIVKPIMQERLDKALNRFFNREKSNTKTEKLTFQKRGNLEIIQVSQIKYIKAIKHYSEVYLENGSKIFHDKSLTSLITILPLYFARIHKSYVVNLNYVSKIQSLAGSQYKTILNEGTTLPIGRTKILEIKKRLIEL